MKVFFWVSSGSREMTCQDFVTLHVLRSVKHLAPITDRSCAYLDLLAIQRVRYRFDM